MARPKSDKPTKTVIKTIRLTVEDCKLLTDKYGSVQIAIDKLLQAIKTD